MLGVLACDRVEPEPDLTKRVVLIQGACSSTEYLEDRSHWANTVKRELASEYGFIDMPTGDPADQVIEFSYSDEGWDAPYAPSDTLKAIEDSSDGLARIYAAYPDSEFYIIGHSLGGVVALDALARSIESDGDLVDRTLGVATVSSPVRGLTDSTSAVAAFTIELLVCRDISGIADNGEVWDDLVSGSETMTRIHTADWDSLPVYNFANKRDRVTNWEIAYLGQPFRSYCFDLSSGLIDLNHDTVLKDADSARAVLGALIDSEPVSQSCSG